MNPFEIAKQVLSFKPQGEPRTPGRKAFTPPSDYAALAASGKIDLDVHCLDEAIFLFALNTVRNCLDADFMNMGHAYCPFWRARLMPEAWRIIVSEIKIRLEKLKRDQSAEQTTKPHEG